MNYVYLVYNENHTTCTKRTLVYLMAVRQRVTINPDHLLGGDGSMEMALSLWSSRNPPVIYNQFQSLYYALRRDHNVPVPLWGDGQTEQSWLRTMHREIQTSHHGPDFAALAVMNQQRTLAADEFPAALPIGLVQQEQGGERRAGKGGLTVQVFGASGADHRPVGTPVGGGGEPASDPVADELPSPPAGQGLPMNYEIATPRENQRAASEFSMGSPDHWLMTDQVRNIMADQEPAETEDSAEQKSRLGELAENLADIGDMDRDSLTFLVKIELLYFVRGHIFKGANKFRKIKGDPGPTFIVDQL